MSSEYGNTLRMTVSGTSHGPEISVRVKGFPAGEAVDTEKLQRFLSRRAPGQSALTTSRKEADEPEFTSGLREGVLTGEEFTAVIRNTNARSSDYRFGDTPRPSHADYTAFVKYGGKMDMSGGGPFSGRLTAPVCIAGGIAKQLLEKRGIFIGAHLLSVGNISDAPFPLRPDRELLLGLADRELPVIDGGSLKGMKGEILAASADNDSVGGVVECAVTGFPAGMGGPLFDGIEGRIAGAMFGVPGVKGVSFGSGFGASGMRGSEHNDPFTVREGKIETVTNNSGGIQGGISNGMPILIQTAFKPTPSIGLEQRTVSLSRMEETTLTVAGRHDPCIAVRAVPVVEAVTAFVLLDMLLGEERHGTE